MGATLRRLDRGLYILECAIAWLASLGIVGLMFVSVIHRIFERREGRLSTLLLWGLGKAGIAADPALIHGPVSTALNLGLGLLLCLLAVRTTRGRAASTWARDLALAAGLTAALAGAVFAVLSLLPDGLPWAVKGSLTLVILMGFLGASMATYEGRHLTVEVGEKIWPAALAPKVRRLAGLVTAAFCLLIAFLALLSVRGYYVQWVEHPLTALLDDSLEVPKWAALAVIPHAFLMIGLRFLGQALGPDGAPLNPEGGPT